MVLLSPDESKIFSAGPGAPAPPLSFPVWPGINKAPERWVEFYTLFGHHSLGFCLHRLCTAHLANDSWQLKPRTRQNTGVRIVKCIKWFHFQNNWMETTNSNLRISACGRANGDRYLKSGLLPSIECLIIAAKICANLSTKDSNCWSASTDAMNVRTPELLIVSRI